MDKKSGIYYYLTDNSLRAGGSSTFGGIVPMYTTKGIPGKVYTVTAMDYRDKLGYDLDYNPNYAGLDLMLSGVTRLDVIRMNPISYVGNVVWYDDAGTLKDKVLIEKSAVEVFEDDVRLDGDAKFWVCHVTPGKWGEHSVFFEKTTNTDRDEYVLHYKDTSGILRKTVFSLDPEEDDFYSKVDFKELVLGFADSEPEFPAGFLTQAVPDPSKPSFSDSFELKGGSYGEASIDDEVFPVTEINTWFAPLATSNANVFVLNGFVNVNKIAESGELVKALVNYFGSRDISVLIDAPTVEESEGILDAVPLSDWTKSLLDGTTGQFGQVAAIPGLSGGIKIQPSVYLFQIYSNMFFTYGHVNFPPAGPTYGTVSAARLMDSNFHLYGDELKTGRVNYITGTPNGICMWEQRTLYSLGGSDLSYANTVFILRDLKVRLIEFMSQFTFRYSTPIDLLTIHSGLQSILDGFVKNMFLVNYTLMVPTYEEAQAAGRELDINIGVSVISDMEVINLRINLKNAADLRAA